MQLVITQSPVNAEKKRSAFIQMAKQLKASGKGGKPGQWSARKAQRLALEYKKRGGGYTS